MKNVVQEIALFIYRHEYIVPLSAVPLFLMFRLVFPKLKGSVLILSLSMPGLVYPLGLAGAEDVLGAMIVWFSVIPAAWIIPLVALASAMRLWLVVAGRWEDPPFLSRQTILICTALLALYASIWWERYMLSEELWASADLEPRPFSLSALAYAFTNANNIDQFATTLEFKRRR